MPSSTITASAIPFDDIRDFVCEQFVDELEGIGVDGSFNHRMVEGRDLE